MKRTIFYSWQSDLASAGNRNLIDECLRRSIKAIGRDEDASVEPVLDRDTANVPGTPDIAARILAKIAMADVFVADVSIVNRDAGGRPTPNPNVLVELGYAIAELGWDNVLLVQNGAFGGPELLPFDLRGRRTVVYDAPEGFDKKEVRGLLQGRLEGALRAALAPGMGDALPTGVKANLWWGPWSYIQRGAYGGNIFIREVGPDGFLFDINVSHGAHTGSMTAYARIVSHDLAYCRVANGDDGDLGELVFRRQMIDGRRIIEVEETVSCSYYRGMRANFGGKFERRSEPWFDAGFLNELELARLYALTGNHMEKMRSCTGSMGDGENADNFQASVIWGGVAGLFTIMESILMVSPGGDLWCAYLDGDKVHYFTTSPAWGTTLPITINEWRTKFIEKEVVFHGRVEVGASDSME